MHSADEVAFLAELGFTHVVNIGFRQWEEEAERCHAEGLKLIARWPDWYELNMVGPRQGFQNHEGVCNAGFGSRVDGPSVWNLESQERAIQRLHGLSRQGIDGVLIHGTVSDRNYPGDWYGFGQRRWLNDYWSFDKDAQAEWNELGHGPMPEHPTPSDPDNRFFYSWYLSGWYRRLATLTEAAIAEGLENIWTWFIPLLGWSVPNMAGGMTDSDRPMEVWRRQVQASGRVPVNVISTLFPLGDKTSRTETKRLADSGWDIIAGIETCSVQRPLDWGRGNTNRCKELGIGVFGGDRAFLDNREEAKRLFSTW